MQKPKLTPDELQKVVEAEKGQHGNSPLSHGPPLVRREVVLKGETKAQAKRRWAREREIERDRERDPLLLDFSRLCYLLVG